MPYREAFFLNDRHPRAHFDGGLGCVDSGRAATDDSQIVVYDSSGIAIAKFYEEFQADRLKTDS